MGLFLFLVIPGQAAAGSAVESTGDILQLVLPAAAAGVSLGHDDLTGLFQFGEAGLLTWGVTYTLKYTIDAKRPNGGRHSFPSGHTSISFCSAEYLRKRYGWEFGLPAYTLAAFVGYSRVESRSHYARDVIAGAALGVTSSYLFTVRHARYVVVPEFNSDYFGFWLMKQW